MLSIEKIIEIEPRVKSVFEIAKVRRRGGYKAFAEIKKQLSECVGFCVDNPLLQGHEVYELCIQKVADILNI